MCVEEAGSAKGYSLVSLDDGYMGCISLCFPMSKILHNKHFFSVNTHTP